MFGFIKRIWNTISTTRNPADWFLNAIGGRSTYSKVRVNRNTALSLASINHAIQLISGDIAKIPLHLHRSLPQGGKERAKSHPSSYLMLRKPNEYVNAFHWKRSMIAEALLHGNSYSYITRDGNYYPQSLVQLDSNPNITFPVRENGVLLYITYINGQPFKIDAHNMFHIRGLSSDGITGYSFLDLAKETVGLGVASERLAASFFGSGSITSGILEYPQKLDPAVINQIREQWGEIHSGLENSHKIAVLDKGVSFKPLTLPNDVSQFIETRKFTRQDIASWFCLPATKIGDERAKSHNSLESEQASYLASTLDAWFVGFEMESFDKLLSEREKHSGDYDWEFLRAAILKPDTKTRYEIYRIGIQNAILSPNEVRDMENQPPYEGGDKYVMQKNMDNVNIEESDKEELPTNYKPYADLLDHAYTKLLNWQVDAINKAAKNPEKFLDTVEKFLDAHKIRMVNELSPVINVINNGLGLNIDVNVGVDRYIQQVHDRVLESAECSADDLVDTIKRKSQGWNHKLFQDCLETTDLFRIGV